MHMTVKIWRNSQQKTQEGKGTGTEKNTEYVNSK